MNASPHRDLGLMWLQRGRADKAIEELRLALTADPEDAEAMAYMAGALLSEGKLREGLASAEAACGLVPEWPWPHRVRAVALVQLERKKEAEAAARTALELDADDAASHSTMAMVFLAQKRWRDAVAAAQAGLKIDPEDTDCLNVRATALIQLGEADAARLDLDAALAHDPDDADTHENLGWAKLSSGRPKEAEAHYLEALRLDPGSDNARGGLVEALKAQNSIYRIFLAFFLWMGRLPPMLVFGVLIGSVLARSAIARAAEANPTIAPLLWSVFWAIVAFVLMTWLAAPLFNLLLRLHKTGKNALSHRQIVQSNGLLALLILAGIATLMWIFATPFGESSAPIKAAIFILVLTIPVTGILGLENPRVRWLSSLVLLAFLALAVPSTVIEYQLDMLTSRFYELANRLPANTPLNLTAIEEATRDWPPADRAELRKLLEVEDDVIARRRLCDRLMIYFVYLFAAWTWGFALILKRDRST